MPLSVNLQNYMQTNPIQIEENANLFDAMDTIIDNRVSGICVTNGNGELVGILSEMDCLRAVLSSIYNESGVGKVRDAMTHDTLVTANPSEDIIDIAQDMLLKNQRRRPVIKDGKLIGQITCRQVLNAVRNFKR